MGVDALLTIAFRHRGVLLLLLTVPVVAAALRGSDVDPATALLGAGFASAGVALRLWAVRHIGRGARTKRPHASAGIIEAGPYRWSRNPLYLAAALMLCGIGLLAGGGATAVALLPATLLAYTLPVLAEERVLTALFGDAYHCYCKRVPRWIGAPAVRAGAKAAPVSWSEVCRREKWLVPGCLAAVIAIFALRSDAFQASQLSDRLELGIGLAALLWAAAALVAGAWVLKVEWDRRS